MKIAIIVSVLAILALTGCAGVAESMIDPQGYTARSQAQSEALRSQAEAQQAFAESQKAFAESEAERSRSEAQRAQAEAQAERERSAAAQAQAEAQAAAAQAQADFATAATKAVKDAANQNKGVLVFAIALIAGMAAWMIHNNTKIVVAVTQQQAAASTSSRLLAPPYEVQLLANNSGCTPRHDGQRWLLIDQNGTVRYQQKLLEG